MSVNSSTGDGLDALDRRWAERDRRRAAHERWMAERAKEHRDHHVDIVAAMLMGRYGLGRTVAEDVVDELLNAGVVFAYMSAAPSDGEPTP